MSKHLIIPKSTVTMLSWVGELNIFYWSYCSHSQYGGRHFLGMNCNINFCSNPLVSFQKIHVISAQKMSVTGFCVTTRKMTPEHAFQFSYTVMDIKDWTLHRAIEVKVPWLRAVPAMQEWILPLKKWVHFFLGPWLLVCQFTDISNQMESSGEVSNVEQKNL